MKHIYRMISLLLAVILCVSMLPSAVFAADGRSFTKDEVLMTKEPLAQLPQTYEAWVYFPENTTASNRGGVILGSYHENGRGIFSFEIYTKGNPRIYITDRDGTTSQVCFTSVNVYNGKWTHIAIVRNPETNTVSCYMNGTLAEDAPMTVSEFVPCEVSVIGGDHRTNNTLYFKGQLRSVSVFAGIRTPSQIKEDMTQVPMGAAMASWDLSTTATSYTDRSLNNYDVTVQKAGRTFRADELNTAEKTFEEMPNTFESWLYFPADTPTSTRGGIILGNYKDGGKGLINFEIYGKGNPRMFYVDPEGNVSTHTFSTVNVYTGAWLHLAIVRDKAAGKLHCYINGELKESANLAFEDFLPSTPLVVGGDCRTDNSKYFLGQLRSVTVYSSARTKDQVVSDMNAQRNTDALASWDLRAYAVHHPDLTKNGYSLNRTIIGNTFKSAESLEAVKALSAMPNTMEAWVYFPADTPAATRGGVIVGNYPQGNKGVLNFEIFTNGNPRMYYIDHSGTVSNLTFKDVNVYTGQWVHLALVRDNAAGKAHCYVNGTLEQSLDLKISSYDLNGMMRVGGDHRSGNEQYFKGRIRSVVLYGDARTQTEIQADKKTLGNGDPIATWNLQNRSYSYSDLSGKECHLNRVAKWFTEKEPITDYDYTFAILGDTQVVSLYDSQNGTKNLKKVYNWILSQKDAMNIQYVMGLGDITDKNTATEWELAQEAIHQLNGQIPYSIVRGNHDGSANINKYFNDPAQSPYSTTYEGSYDGTLNNTWRTITVGTDQIPYLIMTLDYGPTDQILAWADQVVSSHPDHNVILTTHCYLYRDGTTLDSGDVCPPSKSNAAYNNGDQMWDKFVSKHENIVLMLSGHDPCAQVVMRQDPGVNGNIVTQFLIDPQGEDKTTLTGAVALFHFSQDGKKVTVEYYSPIQEAYFMTSNQFDFEIHKVEKRVDDSIVISHSLNLVSDISVNYVVSAESLSSYDSFYLECTLPTYSGNTQTGSVVKEITGELKGDRYYFTLDGITALQMNDMIEAKLCLKKNGASYESNTDVYSIATYAYNQLKKTAIPASLKKVCANLLQYGAAAQMWRGYRTDHLASRDFTPEQQGYLTELTTVTFGNNKSTMNDLANPLITWSGKGLSLEDRIVVRFILNFSDYTGELSDLVLKISYVDGNGTVKRVDVTDPVPYNLAAGLYSFDFDGLNASEMRSVLSAAVYAGETRISQTGRYSIDTYGNNKSGAILDLCRAMVAYGDAASEYFS